MSHSLQLNDWVEEGTFISLCALSTKEITEQVMYSFQTKQRLDQCQLPNESWIVSDYMREGMVMVLLSAILNRPGRSEGARLVAKNQSKGRKAKSRTTKGRVSLYRANVFHFNTCILFVFWLKFRICHAIEAGGWERGRRYWRAQPKYQHRVCASVYLLGMNNERCNRKTPRELVEHVTTDGNSIWTG